MIVKLGSDTYLCVAGFTPGKEKYEQAKNAEHRQGIWGTAFAVEIDHAKHLIPANPMLDLHVCGYICQTAELMNGAQLRGARDWGELSATAVREIAEGLLGRHNVRPYLSKKALTAIKGLVGQ